MENKENQYVELPSKEEIIDITPQDQLVYLGLRSFMNKDTMEAYPSQTVVAQRIGCCRNTVSKCVKTLIKKDYIKTRKQGTVYIFNKLKQFEPFSYKFLENTNLTFTQKALLASTQQYMYDKESGIGKTSYSKKELADKINMSYPTLVRTTKELQEKDVLQIIPLKGKDLITGCSRQEMQFVLNQYHQGIVKVLLNHEQRIEDNETIVANLLERIEQLESMLNQQK